MFSDIPNILSSEEILDIAFKRIKKITIVDRVAFYKKKKTIIARTESFSKIIVARLELYVKKFPSIENLPGFYQDIIDIKIDIDKLKKSLGAVDWARKTCYMIYSKQSRALKKSSNIDFLLKKQKEIFGRISSVLKQIDKDLINLNEAQKIMKKMPGISDIPTIVIAGYPNVGKSSILQCLSSAKPKIAQYPFTTKEIYVGHFEKKEKYNNIQFQIIDTPGLLDRPFDKRNDIEKQALSALGNLADLIVFVFDPSETCGYSINDQENLFKQIKKNFDKSAYIIVENKSDIKNTKSDNLKISCDTKEGIDQLKEEIIKKMKKEND